MNKKNILYGVLVAFLLSSPLFAIKKAEIASSMKTKIDKVITILKNKSESDAKKGSEIIALMNNSFDYELMSKLALGKDVWSNITPAQRATFTKKFESKLKQSYVDKIKLYENQTVDVLGVSAYSTNRLQLKTKLKGAKESYPINYNLYNKGGDDWYIYDIELAGVSIVQTYRQQFAGVLQTKTFNQLLQSM